MRKGERFKDAKAQAADALGLPKDVIVGEPVITITGRRKVYIENYNRIISFTDQEIRLQAKTCKILICGKRIRIEYYTKDEMLIAGQITAVMTES